MASPEPIRALDGLTKVAGCLGPFMMRSALALLLSARQTILDGLGTGASQRSASAS